MVFNSGLEDGIEILQDGIENRPGRNWGSIPTWRMESLPTWDEITSDLGRNHFRPGGRNWEAETWWRNHFRPGAKSLPTWRTELGGWNWEDEITSDLGRNHLRPRSSIPTSDLEDGIARNSDFQDEITSELEAGIGSVSIPSSRRDEMSSPPPLSGGIAAEHV